MKRKQLLSLVLGTALMMSTVLSACGEASKSSDEASASGTAKSSTQEATTQTEPKESVALSVIISKDWYNDSVKHQFDRYQQKTGNKLDVQVSPGGQAFNDAINAKAAVNELPDIIYYYSGTSTLKSIKADTRFMDLSNEPFNSKILPAVTNAKLWLTVDGKVYCAPYGGMNVSGIIYNKKIFADNGVQVPKNWDEFMATCQKLKDAKVTPIFESIKDGWPYLIFHYLGVANEIQKSKADDIFGKINTGKYDVTKSPEFRNVIQRHQDLYKKGYMNKDAGSATYDAEITAISTGKCAMIIQADWAIPTIQGKYPDALKDLAMFPLPWDNDPYTTISDPQGIAISKDTKNPEEAKGFIGFITSDEELSAYYSEIKNLPFYKDVKSDLGVGTADLKPLVDAGKAVPWYPSYIKPYITFDFPATILGAKSVDQVLKEAHASMIKSGKDNKVEGY